MDFGDEPLPMIKRGPFSMPMGGPFSTPIDKHFRRTEEPMGVAAASRRRIWRAAASPRASSRCSTIGGTSSFVWPNRTDTGRRTSRPLLLHAIATRSRHARQTTLTIASPHAKAVPSAKALRAVAMFLRALVKTAEQLSASQRWAAILAKAFQAFLNGRPLRLPPRLVPS